MLSGIISVVPFFVVSSVQKECYLPCISFHHRKKYGLNKTIYKKKLSVSVKSVLNKYCRCMHSAIIATPPLLIIINTTPTTTTTTFITSTLSFLLSSSSSSFLIFLSSSCACLPHASRKPVDLSCREEDLRGITLQ